MIEGRISKFRPSVVKQLCQAPTEVADIVMQNGTTLEDGVDRARAWAVVGISLTATIGRFTGLVCNKAALRQWMPRFSLSADERTQ